MRIHYAHPLGVVRCASYSDFSANHDVLPLPVSCSPLRASPLHCTTGHASLHRDLLMMQSILSVPALIDRAVHVPMKHATFRPRTINDKLFLRLGRC